MHFYNKIFRAKWVSLDSVVNPERRLLRIKAWWRSGLSWLCPVGAGESLMIVYWFEKVILIHYYSKL